MTTDTPFFKPAIIAGILATGLLYLILFLIILGTGHGRAFVDSDTRWSASLASGAIAVLMGGWLGGFFVITDHMRKQDRKIALISNLIVNGGTTLSMGLNFGRITHFSWHSFLDYNPQASVFLSIAAVALCLFVVQLQLSLEKPEPSQFNGN